ncbi:MAG: glycosyltransferase [Lachnospiraceae bacterium]|nr:glycosyltransferase [Lachnospiraceae bacterium]
MSLRKETKIDINGTSNTLDQLISVIIPVYNVQDYLRECVESVRHQTYSKLEILLIDDGSTDESGTICDELAETDDRISVIHRKNGGLSAARNTGLGICKGEYVCFIDSDDRVSSLFVETLYKMCVESGSKVAVAGISIITADGSILSDKGTEEADSSDNKKSKYTEYTSRQVLDRFYDMKVHIDTVVAWNKLYRRDVIGDFLFPEGYVYEDEATTFAYLYYSDIIAWTDLKLYFYRERSGSITKNDFSLKRMDVLNAYKRRRDFYLKHGEQEYALREEYYQLSAYLKYYYLVGKNLPEEKQERKKLAKQFRTLYRNYDRRKWEGKRKVLYGVCYIFPSLYGWLESIKDNGRIQK